MPDSPIRIEGLLVEIESTYRTDPTPSAATNSVILAEEFSSTMVIENRAPNLRENVRDGTLMPVAPGVPRGRTVSGTIVLEMRGAGAAYAEATRPEADALIRSSGYNSVVVTTGGSETVTYSQEDSGFESCTMYAYSGGAAGVPTEFRIVGVRCNMVWPIVAGELNFLRFDFIGFLDAAPTTVALPAQPVETAVPQSAVGMSLTVGSWSPDIITGEFNSGAVLSVKPSGNDATGFAEVQIASFDPRITFSAPTVALATYNPYADRVAATTRQIDWTVGGSQYNRADLVVASSYLVEEVAHENQDGFAAWGLAYRPIDMAIVFD